MMLLQAVSQFEKVELFIGFLFGLLLVVVLNWIELFRVRNTMHKQISDYADKYGRNDEKLVALTQRISELEQWRGDLGRRF